MFYFLFLNLKFLRFFSSSYGFNTFSGQIVDTVVMNPPFGTRKKGADIDFLFVALKVKLVTVRMFQSIFFSSFYLKGMFFISYMCQVASQAVYSLHKTSTRDVSNDTCSTLVLFCVNGGFLS